MMEETYKKVLALDSSGLVASVAVVEGDGYNSNLLAEYTVNYKKTHSQTLLPMLDAIVKMTELDLKTIDAIAVAAGPGSFTGLRIGSATAKGLGLALEKPLVAIPTVDALAYNLYGTEGLICPLMDARRNQVYTGIYAFESGNMKVLEPQMAVDIEVIAEKLCRYGRNVVKWSAQATDGSRKSVCICSGSCQQTACGSRWYTGLTVYPGGQNRNGR